MLNSEGSLPPVFEAFQDSRCNENLTEAESGAAGLIQNHEVAAVWDNALLMY